MAEFFGSLSKVIHTSIILAVLLFLFLSFGNGGYAAFGGLPHITIPYFNIGKFPVGISLIGRPWSDAEIISYAAALEIEWVL